MSSGEDNCDDIENDVKMNKNIHKCCSNCEKSGHDYKHCDEPITSWGIILVKIDQAYSNVIEHCDVNNTNGGVAVRNKKDLSRISENIDKIRFLMISRKHSLGYIDFLRGRYKPDNIEGIIYLFQQMTPNEIHNIGKKFFYELWDDFWSDDIKRHSQSHKREFDIAKNKYEQLKKKINVELNLDFYVNNVKSLYGIPEWGFPKGRKSRGESNINCAIREFCEETNFSACDIKIITNIKPIIEDITGTNGIKYRHIYYVAEFVSDVNDIMKKEHKNNETGDIDFFTYEQAMTLIREYHIEKKNILLNVFMYYLNLISKVETCDGLDKTNKNQ